MRRRRTGAAIGAIAAVSMSTSIGTGGIAAAQETPVVSDGGPYGAVDVGQPLTLQGEASGFTGDVEVAWALDDPAAPCSIEDADTLTPTITCDEAVEAGIELTVTDLTDGQAYSDATTIRFEDPLPPRLDIDAGGPYVGVVGEPIELHGTVRGIEGEFRVHWSEDAEGIPCTFADETSLDATITCHEPFQVGIAFWVEDLTTGVSDYDIAMITAEAAPPGPSTTTTTRPARPTTTSTMRPSTTSTTAATTTSTTDHPDQLPKTGASSGPLTAVGLLLVGGGASLLGLARRRMSQGA